MDKFKTAIDVMTLAIATLTLISVTVISGYQAYISRDTANRQLKAYIGVGDPKFGAKFPSEIELPIENGGQTPAYNVKAHLNRRWVPFGQGLPDDFDYPDYQSNPDSPSSAYINAGKEKTFTFPITNYELTEVRDGETDLFIYGHVDYEDIFREKRTTTFLYQYRGVNGPNGEVTHRLILQRRHNEAL